MTTLYIIGNGFDMHHGMDTSYWHFGQYLKQMRPNLLNLLDEYLPTYDEKDFWSHFEERLAAFDADMLIENCEQFIVSYGADDWSDAYHHDYAYELDRVVRALSEGLLSDFTAWIRQIAIPSPHSLTIPKAKIDPAARFINFNYTDTLQRLYGVPNDRIWYIHGAAAGDGGLVLGHGWHAKPPETHIARLDPERDDTRIIDGAYIIDRYFQQTFKPTETIIADSAHRFSAIGDVDDIRVLGHSLSDVDLPYFQKIGASVDAGAQWRVSYFETAVLVQEQFEKFANLSKVTFLPLEVI